MLVSCSSCPGFLPADCERCPNCDAAAPRDIGSTFDRGADAVLRKVVGAVAAGAMMVTLMACYGDSSYDGDYWEEGCVDDSECSLGSTCDTDTGQCMPVENCSDAFDNDGDGLVDGADIDDCPSLAFETSCSDGLDDDADGDTDCQDLDCLGDVACYENCSDDIDNDLDGLVDCLDIDCGVCPLTETSCDDGQDDDQDGLVDCDDVEDCAEDCAPAVCGDLVIDKPEECDDGNLDADDGCSPSCTHELEFYCAAAPALVPGSVVASTTAEAFDLFATTCTGSGGPEARYQFTAQAAGTLYLTLDPEAELGIYVTAECPLVTTLACADMPGGLDTVSIDLIADQTVFVMVDGTDPAGGAFELIPTFSPD